MSRYTAGMHRRTFLGTVGAALLSAPLAAGAQQTSAMRRIGILGNVPLSEPGSRYLWGEFTQGMKDLGYVQGQSISIDYVSSDGRYERLPALAAELVRRKAEVIVAPAVQNVVAAKQASATTPIVMASVGDPVGNGLIASLAHGDRNVVCDLADSRQAAGVAQADYAPRRAAGPPSQSRKSRAPSLIA